MGRVMRGAALAKFGEAAVQVGLDPRAMLRALGIDSRVLEDADLRLPADKVIELLERSASESDCETFGLRVAQLRRLSDYGPVSLSLAHQPTMRDALKTIGRYQQMLNEALVMHIEDRGSDLVVIREELLAGAAGGMRQAYELAVGTLLQVFSGPVGPRLTVQSVHFTHGPPSDISFHRAVLGRNIEFNSDFNGVTCRRVDFDRVVPTVDPALAEHAEQFLRTLPYAEGGSLVTEVQKAIHVLLPFDGATIVSVSGRLGLSPRTLQRRLAEEGADFTGLLNEIRREHALRYLANLRLPLAQVAGLVGYNRGTSFARWFASEFGVTPSEWRTSPR
jgi:AraC-like DNA-binding protein